jgi:hypothetical protein
MAGVAVALPQKACVPYSQWWNKRRIPYYERGVVDVISCCTPSTLPSTPKWVRPFASQSAAVDSNRDSARWSSDDLPRSVDSIGERVPGFTRG